MTIPSNIQEKDPAAPRSAGFLTAFTLTELLVAISLIAILASLLLPALARARNSALTTVCLNNQKQLSYAWIMYTMENQEALPPNHGYWGLGCPLRS